MGLFFFSPGGLIIPDRLSERDFYDGKMLCCRCETLVRWFKSVVSSGSFLVHLQSPEQPLWYRGSN